MFSTGLVAGLLEEIVGSAIAVVALLAGRNVCYECLSWQKRI